MCLTSQIWYWPLNIYKVIGKLSGASFRPGLQKWLSEQHCQEEPTEVTATFATVRGERISTFRNCWLWGYNALASIWQSAGYLNYHNCLSTPSKPGTWYQNAAAENPRIFFVFFSTTPAAALRWRLPHFYFPNLPWEHLIWETNAHL